MRTIGGFLLLNKEEADRFARLWLNSGGQLDWSEGDAIIRFTVGGVIIFRARVTQ